MRPGLSLTGLRKSVKGPSLTLGVLKELLELSRTLIRLGKDDGAVGPTTCRYNALTNQPKGSHGTVAGTIP